MDVRTLCIGILSIGDASGYEIKKQLEKNFSYFYDASFGSIYPALKRLQDEALVTCNHESQSQRPDKKVYHLTGEGRLVLLRELSDLSAPDRIRSEFLVAMLFSHLMPAGQISEMIDRRLKECNAAISHINKQRSENPNSSVNFVAGYGIALFETAIDYLQNNRHLVEADALLAQIERDQTSEQAAK